MVTDMVAWLRAQLDEDERVARQVPLKRGPSWVALGATVYNVSDDPRHVAEFYEPAYAVHVARHDPTRVLADVAAKRAILDHVDEWAETLYVTPEGWTPQATTAYRMAMTWTVHHIVRPYADRPGFNPEWTLT